MSDGNRSGVNCSLRKEQASDAASVLASIVLPTPGTSSIRTCPSHSSATMSSLVACRFPTTTLSTLASSRSKPISSLTAIAAVMLRESTGWRTADDDGSEGGQLPDADAGLLQQFKDREKGDDHILDTMAILQ